MSFGSHDVNTVSQNVLRVVVAVILVCSVFFWSHCVMLIIRNSKKQYFIKRGIILLKSYLYLSGINVIFFIPLSLISHIFSQYFNKLINNSLLFTIFWVFKTHILILIAYQSVAIIFLRIFLQYINVRRIQDSTKIKWNQINLKNTRNNHNWIIKYYYIFGNPKKLFFLSLIITLFEIIIILFIVIFVSFPYSDINFSLSISYVITFLSLFWFIFFIFLIYCILKLKNFIDYWEIRNELKYLCYNAYICTIIVIFLLLFSYLFNFYIAVMLSGMYGIATIITWYISIIFVNNINQNRINTNKIKTCKITIDEMLENETCMYFIFLNI